MLPLLALSPILTAIVLMVFLRWPALRAMPAAWLVTAFAAWLGWGLEVPLVLALSLHGAITAVSVLIIVFGALVVLHTLQHGGGMATIQWGMQRVSPDRRVQTVLVAGLFSAFVEGAAGFGTPAALAAPLLVSLGFPPLAAAVLCVVLNSYPVTFGAVGTPLTMGLDYLQPLVEANDSGFVSARSFERAVGGWASVLQAPLVVLLPILMLGVLTRSFGSRQSCREGFAAWRFATFAGVAFLVPQLAFAWLLGPEFPSLIGGLLGLAIAVTGARRGWFVPAQSWDFPPREQWPGAWSGDGAFATPAVQGPQMSLWRAWLPYVLIGVILVVTRVEPLGLSSKLRSVTVEFDDLLGYAHVDNTIEPLFLPGTIPFLLVALLTIWLHGMPLRAARAAWTESVHKLWRPAIALTFAVAMVSIFRLSAVNAAQQPSMPLVLAEVAATAAGGVWPFLAAFLGGLGSFVTGSATVSNLLFAEFQWGMATQLGLSRQLVLAAQASGAAMGNMVAIHNLVAVGAVVGLVGREGLLLRRTFRPFVLYGVVVGGLATALVVGLPALP